MLDRSQAAALASELLRIPFDDALAISSELEHLDAFLHSERVRGGRKLIVGRDGSVLFAHSSMSASRMIEDFAAGERTDRALFGSADA